MQNLLREVELFRLLTDEQLQLVANSCVVKSFRRGGMLVNEEDPADGVYFIKRGYVRVYQLSETGKERTLTILSKGDIIGEMAMWGNHTRSASVMALEPTECLFIPRDSFNRLVAQTPDLSVRLAALLSERLRQTSRQIAREVSLGSREKVVAGLLNLAGRFGAREGQAIIIQPRLTHHDLACLVGVVRETVSKVLSELQKQGLVSVRNRRIVLLEPQLLRELHL